MLRLRVSGLSALFSAALLSLSFQAPAQSSTKAPAIQQDYGKLPLSFEANQGQIDPAVRFTSRGNGYSLFLTGKEAVLSLSRAKREVPAAGPVKDKDFGPRVAATAKGGALSHAAEPDTIRMQLTGANPNARVSGEKQLPGTANYFLGNDPAQWHTAVPTYAQVKYAEVYQGIDLLYYGNQRQLEYDFVLAPYANPRQIQLHFDGATQLRLAKNGDLEIKAQDGQIAFHKPTLYQQSNGRRQPVEGAFTLLANNTIGFHLGAYDRSQPLIIDPVLAYSTFFGGTNISSALSMAVDASGSAYIAGMTGDFDLPLSHPLQNANLEKKVVYTAFVAKFSPDGKSLVYSTYLGGSGGPDGLGTGDQANGIAVDSSGEAYVCGRTDSVDFPTTEGAFQRTNLSAAKDQASPFVSKISASGSALVYSTFIGGSGDANSDDDAATAIAIDSSGDAYVTGYTFSSDFPTENPYQSKNMGQQSGLDDPYANAFLAKLNPTGSALVYSTYLGGSDAGFAYPGDVGYGIAVDSTGDAYVAGTAVSENFPITAGAFQASNGDISDLSTTAFVTKFNPTGSALLYSTFLGGNQGDYGDTGAKVKVDTRGNAYVIGTTDAPDFPTTAGVLQPTSNALASLGTASFVAKLNPTGSALVYSTYLSGSTPAPNLTVDDEASDLAIDSAGDVYVTGYATSRDFPVTPDALQSTDIMAAGGQTGFFAELNPEATALAYSTYLGGHGEVVQTNFGVKTKLPIKGDWPQAMAIDASGAIYLSGYAHSSDFPTTVGTFQDLTESFSSYTSFLSKFSTGTAAPINAASYIQLTSSSNPQVAGALVTFTATVKPSSGKAIPTGTVTFGEFLGTPVVKTLSEGVATYTTKSLAIDSQIIGATYSGDATYLGAKTWLAEWITPPTSIQAVSGSGQSSKISTAFALPLKVLIVDSNSKPLSGVPVSFAGTGLAFSSTTATTGGDGTASVVATPTVAGNLTANATTPGIAAAASFTLTGISPTTPTPTISPAPGTYTTVQTVTMTDALLGSVIYYTTDNSIPTSASPQYTNPLKISASVNFKAIAIAPSHTQSAIAAASYVVHLPSDATPTFNPPGGTHTSAISATLASTTAGAVFYYTIDGSTPTTASTKYAGRIVVPDTETIKAIAISTGHLASPVASSTFYIHLPAATPTFTPVSGAYTTIQTVAISDATAKASIYYTITGATPTVSSARYTAPFQISKSTVVKAVAITNGYSLSAIGSANYVVHLPVAATPTFTPAQGSYTGPHTITLADTTPGATLYYTTNGSTPTASSTMYTTAGIPVSATTTIKVIAIAASYINSAIASATYHIQ